MPRALAPHGWEVIFYGSEGVDRDTWNACSEYVGIITDEMRTRWFGQPRWDETAVFDRWDANDPCWTEWNGECISAIADRIKPGDALALIAGWCQNAISLAFPNNLTLEPGVGYPGILPQSHRAFESHAWRSFCAGQAASDDVRYFDTVIPNFFGLDEFDEPREHDGYLLFIGRATERKGLPVVRELATRFPVKCAGQSDPGIPGAEYVGLVRGGEKAKLLSGAVALLAPTTYFGPFEGVAVEAMMSGVPAITTDWGAFPELIEQGVDGWRCHTLREFTDACELCAHLGIHARQDIATRARDRWSIDAVGPMFDEWLRRVDLLNSDGWYAGVT